MNRLLRYLCVISLWILSSNILAAELPVIRVGVLKFGTVSWELDAMQRHGIDQQYGFALKVLPLGSTSATGIALQRGKVDIIVSDWLWAHEQRNSQRQFSFYPYSTMTGGLVVNPQANIHSLSDLKGKRIGVAGGPTDKTWLLINAYSEQTTGMLVSDIADVTFAAPPLLNQLFINGQLDAVVNYWHYNARLSARDNPVLLNTPQVLQALGVEAEIPLLGWIFDREWADQNANLINNFLAASAETKVLLKSSNSEWVQLRPLMNANNEEVFVALRDAYRAGIPRNDVTPDLALLNQILQLLHRTTDLLTGLSPQKNHNNVTQQTFIDERVLWSRISAQHGS